MRNFRNIFLLTLFLFAGQLLFCQTDSVSQKYITVHFLYGSKPARGYKDSESKTFGGIHGGHVSIQIDSMIFSFMPASGWKVFGHIFSHKHKCKGGYFLENEEAWENDTAGEKYTSIQIPITDSQYVILKDIEKKFLAESPYDYAFFGMRCAAAAADVLSQIGILKKRSVIGDICKNFYPKRLRRKLLRYAKKHNATIIQTNGKISRKWEKD